jgi:hypothetical protein
VSINLEYTRRLINVLALEVGGDTRRRTGRWRVNPSSRSDDELDTFQSVLLSMSPYDPDIATPCKRSATLLTPALTRGHEIKRILFLLMFCDRFPCYCRALSLGTLWETLLPRGLSCSVGYNNAF